MMQQAFTINRLTSGGLITNYFCTSRCRHCLYNCSPDWPKEFIDPRTAETIFKTIRRLGCHAIHIGGGEPMLRIDTLMDVLDTAADTGVRIDYVETNSSWYRDATSAVDTLARLKQHGLTTLLVSISPFHNEHIPFKKVEGVIHAARQAGINLFPWVEGFIADLSSLETGRAHPLSDYEAQFGTDYLQQVMRRYWLHPGGRALDVFRSVLPGHSLEQIIEQAGSCAADLSDTSHFHVDLFGNYIPGLCSGLAIAAEDLGRPLDSKTYPLLQRLYVKGIRGIYEWSCKTYGFEAGKKHYVNKCDLCTEIRTFLTVHTQAELKELQPAAFYKTERS